MPTTAGCPISSRREATAGSDTTLFKATLSESTIVPVARRIADSVGDRSRAAAVLYRRVLEVVTPEEAEAASAELLERIRIEREGRGEGGSAP